MAGKFEFTVITSETPLGKAFQPGPAGAVTKKSLGHLVRGLAEVKHAANLREFALLRSSLTTRQALTYGRPSHEKAVVIAKGSQPPRDAGLPIVHRDAASFAWSSSPGLLMLDHDPAPGADAMCAKDLVFAVCESMPAVEGHPMLWTPSAGSCIYDAASGKELVGVRGSRLYILVDDAREIPALGMLLFDRLALAGLGRIMVSTAGSLLQRGVIDAAVWQAERLDFVHATTASGLAQRPAAPVLFWEESPPVPAAKTLESMALTSDERHRLAETWAELMRAAAPAGAAVRTAWAERMARKRLGDAASPHEVQAMTRRLSKAADHQRLDPDHVLLLQSGQEVTVAEVLADLSKYRDQRLADPFEPEYGGGDRRIAMFTVGTLGQAGIYSHAHGGQTYLLRDRWSAEEDFDDRPSGRVPGQRTQGWGTASAPLPALRHDNAAVEGASTSGKRIPAEVSTVADALRRPEVCGVLLAFDSFTNREMLAMPGDGPPQWRDITDNDMTRLREHLQRSAGFKPISRELVRDVIAMVCEEHRFDSAQEWLSRLSWDGKPRVEQFLSLYFGVEDSPYARAVSRYIWTALAGRVLQPGAKADMVPVAVGAQGARKSSTVAAMAPSEEFFVELNLGQRDDDTSRMLQGRLVVELAELRGLKSRESESIKAFLSARHDSWIEKYKTRATNAPRRCLFFGTSNSMDILSDSTGNRRWLPFAAGRCDPDAMAVDRDQLWAEGAALFSVDGVDFAEAERLAADVHGDYTEQDAIAEPIAKWLAPARDGATEAEEDDGWPMDAATREFITIAEVVRDALNITNRMPTKHEETRIATVLKEFGWQRQTREMSGRRVRGWAAPSPRSDGLPCPTTPHLFIEKNRG